MFLHLNKSSTWVEVYSDNSKTLLCFAYEKAWHMILKQALRPMGYDLKRASLVKGLRDGTSKWLLEVNPYDRPVEYYDGDDQYEIVWECHTCKDTLVCPMCSEGTCPTCKPPKN
jgi:hypothetical protein